MTGFGKAEVKVNGKNICIEVKSLNSKQMDLSTRIPGIYRDHELEIRNMIANKLIRGKVDFQITIEESAETTALPINPVIFKTYYDQIQLLANDLGIPLTHEPVIQTILRLPDVLKTDRKEVAEEEWIAIYKGIDEALGAIIHFREQEGRGLHTEILNRVKNIEALLEKVEPFEKQRIDTVKTRLTDTLKGISQDVKIDYDRFEQELIYYLEKLDVTEEKVRLRNHCKYFVDTMNDSEPSGRKLGFISQEMGREINTLGSKANHADIQKIVVMMKDELEKIKEQLLNVL